MLQNIAKTSTLNGSVAGHSVTNYRHCDDRHTTFALAFCARFSLAAIRWQFWLMPNS
jgi:hypothetical protein